MLTMVYLFILPLLKTVTLSQTGKTTLSDTLIASNGIISQKLSGKLRYLDSRPDEQERGITMKSSAIQLKFKLLNHKDNLTKEFEICLIDSPGHVDFGTEVSTASRLSDGALVLVDAVEGVCTQTITVLKQAWQEQIKPILVINKIDRLITEIKLTPLEAFLHMKQILEQVNAIMATFFSEDMMEQDAKNFDKKAAQQKLNDLNQDELEWQLEEKDDAHIYFSPQVGNVIFASAIDGWAFRIDHFVNVYADKLKINPTLLQKVLWGEYYLDPKNKRVVNQKGLKGRNLKPMFVQFVLENIWKVYEHVVVDYDQEKIDKIVKALGVKVSERDLKTKDVKGLLANIMGQWLPLASTVLVAIVYQLPSPIEGQKLHFPNLLADVQDMINEDIDGDDIFTDAAPTDEITGLLTDDNVLQTTVTIPDYIKEALCACDPSETRPVIAYVSKIFSIPRKEMPGNKRVQLTAEEMRELRRLKLARESSGIVEELKVEELKIDETEHVMIGFARLYSGTLVPGMELYVFGPKYHPSRPSKHVSKMVVKNLYKLMGRDVLLSEKVLAGQIFGLDGIEHCILKNATISSTMECPNLGNVRKEGAPIVRVAVESKNPTEMNKLKEGLKLLNQSDPSVEVYLQETGEHIIATAGELHLERCLNDLKERFAKIELSVSPPLVPFRETISKQKSIMNPLESNLFNFSLVATDYETMEDGEDVKQNQVELPTGTVNVLTPNKQCAMTFRCVPIPQSLVVYLSGHAKLLKRLVGKKIQVDSDDVNVKRVLKDLKELVEHEDFKSDALQDVGWLTLLQNNICSFGPKRIGPNLLLVEDEIVSSVLKYEASIVAGFQMATYAGPLCAEPMQGTCFILKKFEVELAVDNTLKSSSMSGHIMSTVRDACKMAFLQWSTRLMLAMYSCDLQTPSDVLGKVYAVLAKRKGRILAEEMKEGTPFFVIKSMMPVVESFGFADDLRKRTSGAASPQLIFYGFEVLQVDPFWIPTTEEELEDLGEKADRENVAKKYMETVRKRKGMAVDKKIVEHAEKQKTLKK